MVRGVLQLASSAVLARALSFVVFVVVARADEPGLLAEYVLVSAVGGIVFVAGDLGLGQYVARTGAARPAQLWEIAAQANRVRRWLVVIVVLLILAFGAMRAAVDAEWQNSTLMLLSFALQSPAYAYECVARARARMHVEAVSLVSAGVVSLAVVWIGLHVYAEPSSLGFGLLIGTGVRCALARLLGGPMVACHVGPSPSPFAESRGVLAAAAPYAVTTFVAIAFVQVDVLVINLIAGADVVAEYALISRPLIAVGTVAAYACNALIPQLARSRNVQDRWSMVRLPLAVAGAIGVCGGAVVAMLGVNGLELLYGNDASEVPVLATLVSSLYLVVALPNGVLGAYLMAVGLQKYRAWTATAGIGATVVLSAVLVSVAGVVGATSQLVLAELLVFVMLSIKVADTLREKEL